MQERTEATATRKIKINWTNTKRMGQNLDVRYTKPADGFLKCTRVACALQSITQFHN